MIATFRSSTLQLLDVITEPKEAFERIYKGSSIVVLGTIVLSMTMILQYYEFHRAFDALVAMAASQHNTSAKLVNTYSMLYFITQPILIFAKWIAVALLLWLGTLLVTADVSFKACLALVITAQPIQVIHRAVVLIIASINGVPALHRLPDVGLNLLISEGDRGLNEFAGLFNPFTAWYFAILLFGMAYLLKKSTKVAALATLPYVILTLGAIIGVTFVTSSHGV